VNTQDADSSTRLSLAPPELAAFLQASVGLAIVDLNGVLTSVNTSFAELHGCAASELEGTSVTALHLDGEDHYRTPEALRVVEHPEASWEFSARPAAAPDTTVRYRLSYLPMSDGVDRLLLEARPDDSPALPVLSTTVPQLVLNSQAFVVGASPAVLGLLGQPGLDAVVGRPMASLLHPSDVGIVEQMTSAQRHPVGGAGHAKPVEVRVQRPDGALAWVRLHADAAASVSAATGQTVVVLEDLTARKIDELLLHEAFDARPLPFAMVDPTGRVLSANAAWRAAYGPLLRVGSADGTQLLDLFDAEGAAEVAEQLQAMASGQKAFFEVHTLAAVTTVQPRALHLRASALHDLGGRLERILVEFDDVTEPALEMEHARTNAQRVRSTLDQLDHAVVVHDADGVAGEVNLGAHRLFGQGASDLVGQVGLPSWWRPALADGRPLTDELHPVRQVQQGPEPAAECTVQISLPGETPRWFTARARALVEGGRRCGAVVTYVETTGQRVELEEALAAEARRAAIFDALPLPSYTTDHALMVVSTNRAWQQLVEDQGVGSGRTDVMSLAHPADRPALGAAVERAMSTGKPAELFHRLRTIGGVERWVHHHVAPLPLSAGSASSSAGQTAGAPSTNGVTSGLTGTLLEVPEHVALSERTCRLLNLVENTHDLVLEYDLEEGRISYLNPHAQEVFVRPGQPLSELTTTVLYPPDAWELFLAEAWPALRAGERWEGELPMLTADGRRVQVQQWMTGERDENGRLVRVVTAGHDVTDRSQREAELSLRATRDALTGLANRARLLDHLELALGRARRTGQLVGLVFLDLDRFKSVNDRLGHESGDQLLRLAAERVSSAVRPGDTVARIGGDEFVALCDGVDDAAHAQRIADGIVAALGNEVYNLGESSLRATASVGLALSSGDDHPEALLRDADAAMYRAKAFGGARLELFDETMRSRASNRIQLTEELRHALVSGAITVHYQPSIDLHTGRVHSVESLARWQHPERGLLQPGEFIAVADSTGLVLELGMEVLRQACHEARAWQDRWGLAAPTMHVNLSGRQVADPELVGMVSEVLKETRVDPSLICLELTESILLDDSEATIAAIGELKQLGISLAIDDFGTGYSSLSYLSRLPVDVVKVDKSFVDGLDPADGDPPVVAAAIISLARALGLKTIAEGVTTVVQLAELHRLGCDAAQGYYFSTPLDARAIELYLERRLEGGGTNPLPPQA
jgi:diguanylate cyclase (GGDEF)-like protein/PAS domain S-box-containing protein